MDRHPDHEHDAKQLERLTFFPDAVSAIAMTLPVIEVRLAAALAAARAHGCDGGRGRSRGLTPATRVPMHGR